MNYAVSIAGSDTSAGAGLQTDLKTMNACGVWGMTIVAALTAQNGTTVSATAKVDTGFIKQQITTLLDEFPISCWKTGMLNTAETVHAVADALPANAPLVVDPVILSTSGSTLLDTDGENALCHELLPRALIATPNIPEAEYLSGITITDLKSAEDAGTWFLAQGTEHVLIKGGHRAEWNGADYLINNNGTHSITGHRLPYTDIHGTGCCLSSAIASYLAKGMSVFNAVIAAKTFVTAAIEHSIIYPSGRRTVNPCWQTFR